MSKPILQIVAHKLSYLLRDKEVAVIENIRCGDSGFLIEGRIGKEGHFSLPATKEDISALLLAAESLQVVSLSESVVGSDIPNRKGKKADSGVVEETRPEPTKPTLVPSTSWRPPTQPVPTDRKKLTKPGEQELMDEFMRMNSDPYKGRKKLSTAEEKAKAQVYERNAIARSYILAGDRTTVKSWIAFLKS